MIYIPNKKRAWESDFQSWSQPPGKTEEEKCERAIQAIKKAIEKSDHLRWLSVATFPQGSFRNRTNVKQDSDVDVCVLYNITVIVDYPTGVTDQHTSLEPATYHFSQFKGDVEHALVSHFGRQYVRRGNKAFDINENTYRVDADAAPCFEFRQYFVDHMGGLRYHTGTALFTDHEGRRVTNFPEQQYNNGVAKNDATGRRFKKVVRIIKRLRNEMKDAGVPVAKQMASFLNESLVWNVPNPLFAGLTLKETVQDILAYIWSNTKTDADCALWTEENGIKFLFGFHQEWTRQQVNEFAAAAWGYVDSQ